MIICIRSYDVLARTLRNPSARWTAEFGIARAVNEHFDSVLTQTVGRAAVGIRSIERAETLQQGFRS